MLSRVVVPMVSTSSLIGLLISQEIGTQSSLYLMYNMLSSPLAYSFLAINSRFYGFSTVGRYFVLEIIPFKSMSENFVQFQSYYIFSSIVRIRRRIIISRESINTNATMERDISINTT